MLRFRAVGRSLALAFLTATATGAIVPAAATAAPQPDEPTPAVFRNCGDRKLGPTQCARVRVPLDRSGAVAGDVQLAVRRLQFGRKQVAPRKQAVLFLAGGPGQATTPLLADLVSSMKPLLEHRDLLTVDTRGTGLSSDLVVCPELEALQSTFNVDPSLIASCARRLGSAADRYATTDVVADLEAVRRASGYRKLLIVGVSYGTYTAQRYAATHPRQVSGLILDSPLDVTGADPFMLPTYRAIPNVLTQACERAACRGVTGDPQGDLARTIQRLPMSTRVDGGNGRRTTTIIRQETVVGLVLAGDFDPLLRATLPSVLRRAAQGDPAPLGRLARETGLIQLPDLDQSPVMISAAAGAMSTGSYVATTCRDTLYPWTSDTPLGAPRLDAARRALAATTPAQRGGFDGEAIVQDWPVGACAWWPTAPDTAPVPALPSVPTLIISGRDDTRTPVETARQIAARSSTAQLVVVPGQGHSVLSAERRCVKRVLKAFARGRADQRCAASPKPPTAAPLPPSSARSLGRTPEERGQAVARETVDDAVRTVVTRVAQSVFGDDDSVRIAGLRSGSATLDGKGLHLDRMGFVPGTAVTGTLDDAQTALVQVRGSGVRAGTYRVRNPIATDEELMAVLGLGEEITIELEARLRQAIQRVARD